MSVNEEDPGLPRSGSFVSPLVCACDAGHIHAAAFLLDARASFDVPCEYGEFPIMICAREGHADVLQLLLDSRASAHDVFQRHPVNTPLYFAASSGHASTVVTLLSARANPSPNSPSGSYARTPLRSAAAHGHVEVVEAMLSAGVMDDEARRIADLSGYAEAIGVRRCFRQSTGEHAFTINTRPAQCSLAPGITLARARRSEHSFALGAVSTRARRMCSHHTGSALERHYACIWYGAAHGEWSINKVNKGNLVCERSELLHQQISALAAGVDVSFWK
eukprot:8592517-Pyramimonas_sp.AAC.1